MNYFDLKKMSKEDLIAYMAKLSRSYVPNWHMNLVDPDFGSALALIFADMYGDLIEKAKRLPEKHHIDFLNLMNPVQRSAMGSKGYVMMTLSEGTAEGIWVSKGKQLLGNNDAGENLIFETEEDVLLSPAKLESVYVVNATSDTICPVFNIEEGAMTPFFMPLDVEEPNLQKHELKIHAPYVLDLKTALHLDIYIEDDASEVRKKALIQQFSDENKATWAYLEAEQWVPFSKVTPLSNGIRLSGKERLSFQAPDIKLSLKKTNTLQCDQIRLRPESAKVLPDALYQNDVQLPPEEGFLYGRQFYQHDALYIASREVLVKRGAVVTMEMDFVMVPCLSPFEVPEPNVKWKNVLKKSDVPEIIQKDIVMTQMIPEYWNGLGWATLNMLNFDAEVFKNVKEGVNHAIFSFICPEDLTSTTVGAFDNYWIRLKIAQVENAYVLLGVYQAPKLKQMTLTYAYDEKGVMPKEIERTEFLRQEKLDLLQRPLILFEDYGALEGQAIYLKFDKALVGGPTKILFDLGTVHQLVKAKYSWEILKHSAGVLKWRAMDVLDETNHFEETGLLTFLGDTDHAFANLFGEKGYWLRAVLKSEGELPVLIEGIYLNATRVTQIETMPYQYFTLQAHAYNQQFVLSQSHLEKLEVWVNEIECPIEVLESLNLTYEVVWSLDGVPEKIWVKWQPYEHKDLMGPKTRGYMPNLFEGTLTFGDSMQGYLPDNQVIDNVKVLYGSSKGDRGNVSANQIQALAQSIPYVNTLSNPLSLKGGKSPESRKDALERTAKALRHRGRALTIQDFNDLIAAIDYDVHEVKTLSGVDGKGHSKLGAVTSAVLTKNIEANQDYFNNLRDKIYKQIASQLPCTLMAERNYFVIEPTVVWVDVHFKGQLEDMTQYAAVQALIKGEIDTYLDTYEGGLSRKGWHIGELPNDQDLLSHLQMIQGIKAIDHLVMNLSIRQGYQMRELGFSHLKNDPFVIVKNGKHIISLNL